MRSAFELLDESAGYDLVSLASESNGRLGRAALAFPSELGTMAASRNGRCQSLLVQVGLSKSALVAGGLQDLSCARAMAYVSCVHVLAHARGDCSCLAAMCRWRSLVWCNWLC
jgi:hypothetical protein